MSNPENFINEFLNEKMPNGFFKTKKTIDTEKLILSSISNFCLPEEGFVIRNNQNCFNVDEINIPFDLMTLSFYTTQKYVNGAIRQYDFNKNEEIGQKFLKNVKENDLMKVKTIFFLKKNINNIEIHSINCYQNKWTISGYILILSTIKSAGNYFGVEVIESYLNDKDLINENFDPFKNDYHKKSIIHRANIVLDFISAIMCSNVSHEPIKRKKGLSMISAKTMSKPMYESRILVINANKKDAGKKHNNVNVIGSHASPREHLRRGHIRRLENKNIWVNSCIVGSKENGVIKKSYKIK